MKAAAEAGEGMRGRLDSLRSLLNRNNDGVAAMPIAMTRKDEPNDPEERVGTSDEASKDHSGNVPKIPGRMRVFRKHGKEIWPPGGGKRRKHRLEERMGTSGQAWQQSAGQSRQETY